MIVQVATFLEPSAVVAVILTVPAALAVILPLASTVAILAFAEVQVTFLFVVLLGDTVAVNVRVFPTFKLADVLFNLTLVALIGFLTVTLHVATLFPSFVFTVIVAVPVDTAVTFPNSSTVATLELLLSHIVFLFVALLGLIVASNFSLSHFNKVNDVLFKFIPITFITCSSFRNIFFVIPE